jgi:hypothetical protein
MRQQPHKHCDAQRREQKRADTGYRDVDPLRNTLNRIAFRCIQFLLKLCDAIDKVKVRNSGHADQNEHARQIERFGLRSITRNLNAGAHRRARNKCRGAATRCSPPKKYLHVRLRLARPLGLYGDSRWRRSTPKNKYRSENATSDQRLAQKSHFLLHALGTSVGSEQSSHHAQRNFAVVVGVISREAVSGDSIPIELIVSCPRGLGNLRVLLRRLRREQNA